MFAFVVALFDEAEKVISRFSLKKDGEISGKPLYSGFIGGKKSVLLICGIGKVNAAAAAEALILSYSPEVVINFGTAGGADESVSPFLYYAVDKCCQYDFDLTELDPVPLGFMQEFGSQYFDCLVPNVDLEEKRLCTADRFSNKPADINAVRSLKCSLRDMEGAAVAQVCALNKTPVVIIKGVTDTYDRPASQFYQNKLKVCEGFPSVIEKAVSAL